jgi:amino acid adenylation domain-containing protein
MHDDSVAPRGPSSVGEMFLASAARFADRPALWADGASLSYAELRAGAQAIGGLIRPAAARAGGITTVALFVYRTPTAYAAVLGTLLAGAVYCPLNPRFPLARNESILRRCGASIMIVDRRCAKNASDLLRTTDRRMTVLAAADCSFAPDLRDLHDIQFIPTHDQSDGAPWPAAASPGAYVLFTSGSTGAPKGVFVSHANILAYTASIQRLFGPTHEDRFCQLADLTFDISVHDMFVCWRAGACLCVVPERELMAPAAFVRAHGLTFWFSVPSAVSFMDRLHMLAPGALASLRCSIFCGEALFETQAQTWHRVAPNSAIHNLYGPTEATVAITAHAWSPTPGTARKVVPIGRPFPGQQVRLVNENLTPVPPGAIGEICLGGSQVATGYWEDRATTADKFIDLDASVSRRWYRTGDLAHWDEQDGLIFHGRADGQVKIRGFRVELEEIEATLRTTAPAGIAVAVAWPEDANGAALGVVAFVNADPACSEAAIIQRCRRALPDYMVPARIYRVANVPLNANGKIDRQALKQTLNGQPEA